MTADIDIETPEDAADRIARAPLFRALQSVRAVVSNAKRKDRLRAFTKAAEAAVRAARGKMLTADVSGMLRDLAIELDLIEEHGDDEVTQAIAEAVTLAEKFKNGNGGIGAALDGCGPWERDGLIHDWDNPDFSIIEDRRGELPELKLDAPCLSTIREWVEPAARSAGTRLDHVFLPLIGIASGLVGMARRVRASSTFIQPMTCWSADIALSGGGKTPGLIPIMRPLNMLQREAQPRIAEMEREHKAKADEARIKWENWKAEVKEALKNGAPKPPRPNDCDGPGDFVPPRLFVSDGSIERLAVLLQARQTGALVVVDELANVFANMKRYSGGQDNEFWLMAWNGEPYVIERMKRNVYIPHLLIGLTGGMQPDKFVAAFKGDADGMYARFLFGWPMEADYHPLSDDAAEVDPVMYNALARLAALGGTEEEVIIRDLRLTHDALALFEGVRKQVIEDKLLEGRERDWWRKIPSHVLRLAGTLTMIDWALNVGSPEPAVITAEIMQATADLIFSYFWPHTRAALRLIESHDRRRHERTALKWISKNRLEKVSIENIRRDALTFKLDAEQTLDLIKHLAGAGWLREVTPKRVGRGRPARRWEVNPRLRATP